jgi:hypothetical protein
MNQKIAEIFITSSMLAIIYAIGRFIYARFFAPPIYDRTVQVEDLGEDSPVIEALLRMRERYAADGNHSKALEYSTKALERCPDSQQVKEFHRIDTMNNLKR